MSAVASEARSIVGHSGSEALFMHPDETVQLDQLDDPIREICRLQEFGPIVKGVGIKFGDLRLPNIMVSPRFMDGPSYAAVTWEAACAVYGSLDFSSSHLVETIGAFWGPSVAVMDPPGHTKFRAVMQRGFTPKLVEQWHERFVKPSLTGRFARLRRQGKADLVRELTAFYPYEILGQITGFDTSQIKYVADCFHRIGRAQIDPLDGMQAAEELKSYARRLVTDRRKTPTEDYVSSIVRAEVNGELLDDDHAVAFAIHFMSGGLDTVYRMSNNLVHVLLSHPEQLDLLKADHSLIPRAVEEAMRYEGVANIMARLTLQDSEVLGCHIPKGSLVHLIHPAINRDPARWNDPHKFDVSREILTNTAFGFGPHRCIGMHLARKELALFLELILDELPNLRWDPALRTIPKITGWFMRSCLELPVVWDA